MAGKSFRGVGDEKDPALSRDAAPLIADEDDAQGLHSGPTVVDDKKVEEVLRKLRSLDKPPGPLTGVTQAVLEPGSSEPTRLDEGDIQIDTGRHEADTAPHVRVDSGPLRLDEVAYPFAQRATAIGRSPATPAEAAPVTVPADLARGTLFGRSIHLPDVNAPDDLDVEISSAPHFLDGTPGPLAPFPLAEAPAIPPLAPPVAPPIARFHLPFDAADSHTQLVDPPPSRALRNTIAFLGGIAIVGGALWAWSRYGGHRDDPSPPTAAAPAAPAAAPAVAPIPPPAEPAAPAAARAEEAPAPAPRPAAAAARPAAEPPRPAVPADEPAPAATPHAAVKEPAAHSRRTASPSSRHGSGRAPAPTPATAPATAPADEAAGDGKAGKPHKKPSLGEDPDATMAPSE